MIGRTFAVWGSTSLILLAAVGFAHSAAKVSVEIFVAAIAVALLAIGAAMVKHFQGVSIDGAAGILEFPTRLWRGRILLSEIHDANFESGKTGALLSDKKYREFRVNLSGDFGSHQIRFATKARRDQFASILRRIAPHVRISRWY